MSASWVPGPGEGVEVRSFPEILATLDASGAVEGVPFMPEMLSLCGGRFRVRAVLDKICVWGRGMRAIRGDPVLALEDLRCDGRAHGDCDRGCTLLWKPVWLRPHQSEGEAPQVPESSDGPGNRDWPFETRRADGGYLCQATTLAEATSPISTAEKFRRGLGAVQTGEWSPGTFLDVYAQTVSGRVQGLVRRLGPSGTGSAQTPVDRLSLVPGEWVQVKSPAEIRRTLDRDNKNRGLEFSRYMMPFCGGTFRVAARMENFIDDHTGAMRRLKDTVLLEGVTCGGETTSGPCHRAEPLYWREIWLRRVPAPPGAGAGEAGRGRPASR